jgi:serine/threonine-protein kinase RsbW
MAKKSSDSQPTDGPGVETSAVHERRDAAVFVVASDEPFLERVRTECAVPSERASFRTIEQLIEVLSELERIHLAFVLLVEQSGADIDSAALRRLRLDFPQIVVIAILDECDQRCSLRLQSIGVHSILLPPFSDIDVGKELATAIPNVPQFKRHPDLMKRGQARLDFLIPSDLSYVLGINHTVSLLLKEFGFPLQDVRVNIPLVCDEAITNAIVHGNKRDPEKKVNVKIYVSHSRFRIRVRDQGEGFDVSTVEDPREGENVLRSSGRGVFLMKNIMDVVEYKEDGRVLELEKLNTDAASNNNSNKNGGSQ